MVMLLIAILVLIAVLGIVVSVVWQIVQILSFLAISICIVSLIAIGATSLLIGGVTGGLLYQWLGAECGGVIIALSLFAGLVTAVGLSRAIWKDIAGFFERARHCLESGGCSSKQN